MIPLHIPPLRERRECILPLIDHYMQYFSEKLGIKKRFRFTRRASQALAAYSYPGNVRELMNLCERLVVMSEGQRIDLDDLPGNLILNEISDSLPDEMWKATLPLSEILENVEKKVLNRAMQKYGSQARAASALNVNQSTIARKLKKFGL